MYLEIVIAICSILVCIQAVPAPISFYKAIELSVSEPTLKCPSLRISKVFKSEPEFLLKCTDLERARLLTHLKTEENIYDALCLLYYTNFLNLCVASSSFTNTSSALISDSIIENSEYNVEQICEILNTSSLVSSYISDLNPGIEALQNAFGSGKCKRMCTLFDDSIKPICMVSAVMGDTTKKLYVNQTQNQNSAESKNKAVKITKPKLTEAAKSQIDHSSDHVRNTAKKEDMPDLIKEPKNDALTDDKNSGGRVNEDQSLAANQDHQQPAGNDESIVHSENVKQTNEQSVQPGGPSQFEEIKQPAESKALPSNDNQQISKMLQPDQSTKTTVSEIKTTSGSNNGDEQLKIAPKVNETPKVSDTASTNKENNVQLEKGVIQDRTTKMSQQAQKESNIKKGATGQNENEANAEQMPPPEDINEHKEEPTKKIQQDNGRVSDVILPKDEAGIDSLQEFNDQNGMDSQEEDGDMVLGNDGENEDTVPFEPEPKSVVTKSKSPEKSKPREIDEDGPSFAANYQNQNIDDSESYFFSYFMMVCIMFICGYVAYHNKQKILALVVEGRKGRRPSRTRRPNSANYRKLDSNLEEAVTSSCNKNATQVIY